MKEDILNIKYSIINRDYVSSLEGKFPESFDFILLIDKNDIDWLKRFDFKFFGIDDVPKFEECSLIEDEREDYYAFNDIEMELTDLSYWCKNDNIAWRIMKRILDNCEKHNNGFLSYRLMPSDFCKTFRQVNCMNDDEYIDLVNFKNVLIVDKVSDSNDLSSDCLDFIKRYIPNKITILK